MFSDIAFNTIQFGIIIQIILFIIFMWLGYNTPEIEGKGSQLHYMPFSGGLFLLFGGFTFIGLSITITPYISVYLDSMFKMIGIIITIYGILKAFYYPVDESLT